MTYTYQCSAGHVEQMARPYAYQIVGCQAMVKASFNKWDYTTCGLWCWPKVHSDSPPRPDESAR